MTDAELYDHIRRQHAGIPGVDYVTYSPAATVEFALRAIHDGENPAEVHADLHVRRAYGTDGHTHP